MRVVGNTISSITQPELTLVATGSNASSSITIPAHEIGDIIFVWTAAMDSTGANPTLVTISGFTRVMASTGSGTQNGIGSCVFYQIATGTSSFSVTGMNENYEYLTYAIFRPSYPISNVAWTTDFDAYSTIVARTWYCYASNGIGSILGIGGVAVVNVTTPTYTGWTQYISNGRQNVFYKIIDPSTIPTDASITTSSGGQESYQAGYLVIY